MAPCVASLPPSYASVYIKTLISNNIFLLLFLTRIVGPPEEGAVAAAEGWDWSHDGLLAHHRTQVSLHHPLQVSPPLPHSQALLPDHKMVSQEPQILQKLWKKIVTGENYAISKAP